MLFDVLVLVVLLIIWHDVGERIDKVLSDLVSNKNITRALSQILLLSNSSRSSSKKKISTGVEHKAASIRVIKIGSTFQLQHLFHSSLFDWLMIRSLILRGGATVVQSTSF